MKSTYAVQFNHGKSWHQKYHTVAPKLLPTVSDMPATYAELRYARQYLRAVRKSYPGVEFRILRTTETVLV